MELKTPNKYVVDIKDDLNFKENRQMKALIMSKITMDVEGENSVKVPASLILEMEDALFDIVVLSITVGDKVHKTNLRALVDKWDKEDGNALFAVLTDKSNDIMGNLNA